MAWFVWLHVGAQSVDQADWGNGSLLIFVAQSYLSLETLCQLGLAYPCQVLPNLQLAVFIGLQIPSCTGYTYFRVLFARVVLFWGLCMMLAVPWLTVCRPAVLSPPAAHSTIGLWLHPPSDWLLPRFQNGWSIPGTKLLQRRFLEVLPGERSGLVTEFKEFKSDYWLC